ncbi:putative nuclease HARBI1 [Centruroides vittatus]|uniref:putative nuclease HARBI1 n=1 Tax=Centruroides vittatus TaxID=120091 RepID=UPI00350FCAB4
MASDDDVLAILGCLLATNCIKTRKKKHVRRSLWCKEWLKKRGSYSHVNLISELKLVPKDWHNYLRMDEETYLNLLSLVTPIIKKQDTVMRAAISPHERLTVTLRYLATGRSFEDLKFSTVISPQALGYIIPETSDAIYKVLHKDYLKFPRTEREWMDIAKLFKEKWNFPHCLGAMDGKHINIIPPSGSGSEFYNYKGRHSMVLLAIVDAKYQFIMCDFGTNGRVSDGGVLKNTKLFEKLENNKLNIPVESKVRNSSRSMPYVFVVDDAFPLRVDMMKPFRQADLISQDRKIYNYRVSRARRIVENAFGILASRFRIFHTAINLQPRKIESVVMATCVLHNFLMKSVPSFYSPPECFDHENTDVGTTILGYNTEDSKMTRLVRKNPGNTSFLAKKVREDFMDYFVNEGQIPWQLNFI